jgi:hypothetical protein
MAVDLATIVKQLTDSGIIAPGKLEPFIPTCLRYTMGCKL